MRLTLLYVDHSVNLGELQSVVGKYVDQYNLVVAAGPLTGAGLVKTFLTKNKAVNLAVVGSGVWFAVRELSTPMLHLMEDQFGYLQSLLGAFQG
jgi:hypothetical protein